ncbi:MAG: hypothetical protein PHY62_04745 [Gallionella sp.]|nr:hypothetical protein [Gallionella sp.]
MAISIQSVASSTPGSIAEIVMNNSRPIVEVAQQAQAKQSGEIVSLSTKGQVLSQSDRAGSPGENMETRSAEARESASIQFQEGESGVAQSAPSASPEISAYVKVATAK